MQQKIILGIGGIFIFVIEQVAIWDLKSRMELAGCKVEADRLSDMGAV